MTEAENHNSQEETISIPLSMAPMFAWADRHLQEPENPTTFVQEACKLMDALQQFEDAVYEAYGEATALMAAAVVAHYGPHYVLDTGFSSLFETAAKIECLAEKARCAPRRPIAN